MPKKKPTQYSNQRIMKKYIIFLLLTLITIHIAQSQCNVYFADANFKNAILNHNPVIDINNNGQISCIEARSFTGTINVQNRNINSLTGIEVFWNIEGLNCSNNNLTNLSVRENEDLVSLICNGNKLRFIYLNQNTALESLLCFDNDLVNLSVNNGGEIRIFDATQNPSLRCIKVDDEIAANNGEGMYRTWQKDDLTLYSEDCTALNRIFPIPDPNFKTALLNHNPRIDLNSDDEISYTEARLVKEKLDVRGLQSNNIGNLAGIEEFINIKELRCSGNQIQSLDLSQNKELNVLVCSSNQLTALDVSHNTKLKRLWCSDNRLTQLDLSLHPDLENLNCSRNQLTNLDVSGNSLLNNIACQSNLLTSLAIPNNNTLVNLLCHENSLTTLDVSGNTSLQTLMCYSNNLTSLVAKNGTRSIWYFNATTNPDLQCIEVDDEAEATNGIGNYEFWEKDVTSQYSENCTLLNDPAIVSIPDPNFKFVLVNHNPVIDINADAEISYNEAEAFAGTIEAGRSDIADLTGIEAFTNITGLDCQKNQISSIDVTNNTVLKTLICSENQLTSIDVSNNILLEEFRCSKNQLSTLNITNNMQLERFFCSQNQLTSLNVSQNTALLHFGCDDNQLTTIDISNNTSLISASFSTNALTAIDVTKNILLQELGCSTNQLSVINVSKNTALSSLYCIGNPLLQKINTQNGTGSLILLQASNCPSINCIEVDDAIAAKAGDGNYADWVIDVSQDVYSEDCFLSDGLVYIPDPNFKNALLNHNPVIDTNSDNEISYDEAAALTGRIDVASKAIADLTGIEAFINITELICTTNTLSTIDISQNTKLRRLWCHDNQLTSVDVTNNTLLTSFACNANRLSSIDISQNLLLQQLWCNDNMITDLDVSQHTALNFLNCRNNRLETLNTKNGTGSITFFAASNNSSLSCIEVDDEIAARNGDANYANWQKDASAVYAEDCSAYTTFVNIPDPNFKQALISHSNIIDSNFDGEISYAEAEGYYGALKVSNRNISDLTGIEAFTNIYRLFCRNNQITRIDVSKNTQLETLICRNNNLEILNTKNGTQSIYEFDARNNSTLQCIEVDDEEMANNRIGNYARWEKEFSTIYAENCSPYSPDIVNIPDSYFKDALLQHNPIIDTNNDGEISYAEASAVNGTLNVKNKTIFDLTGIEAFINITSLLCSTNYLTALDISANTKLETLECYINQITNIDVSKNTKLKKFSCFNNQLSTLDVSQNTELTQLYCMNNQLTSLDVSNNLFLEQLWCNQNQLTTIDISQNVNVKQLYIAENQITDIDVAANTALSHFDCQKNQLTSLDVSGNPNLRNFWCGSNELIHLDLSQNTQLNFINGTFNQLTDINTKNGRSINFLNVRRNPDLSCIEVDNEDHARQGLGNYTNWEIDPEIPLDVYAEQCFTTLLDNNEEPIDIIIHPNPATDSFAIKGTMNSLLKVTVYTIEGIPVKTSILSKNNSLQTIPVQDLSKGLYLVSVQTEQGTITKPLLIK